MKFRIEAVLLLLAGAGVLNRPTQAGEAQTKAEAIKAETEKFQGTWRLVSQEYKGMETPSKDLKDDSVIIQGDKMIGKHGQQVKQETVFQIEPTATPKTIDLKTIKGVEVGKKVLGIYRLEKDTLTVCLSEKEGDRPQEFKAPRQTLRYVLVFKRERGNK